MTASLMAMVTIRSANSVARMWPIENVSMLAAKMLEDSRIGGSPLEKSTRYIYFDQKVEGEYLILPRACIDDLSLSRSLYQYLQYAI